MAEPPPPAPVRRPRDAATVAAAAGALFDRPLPAAWSDDAAAGFADAREDARPKNRSAIPFRVGAEWFALPTAAFAEVVSRRTVHTVPHRRTPALLGLVNVRGELVPCLSLARLLGMAEEASAGAGEVRRLIVLRGGGGRCALPVREVQNTCRFNDLDVLPAPDTVARGATAFTRGLLPDGGRTLSLLDAAPLLAALDRCLA